jgi:predicted chitinase
MPDENFLENYPLFRKVETLDLPSEANKLPKVTINMQCCVWHYKRGPDLEKTAIKKGTTLITKT